MAWGLDFGTLVLTALETATNAMNQIADGDLGHRVSESIGHAGDAFNRMADRVEGLVSGQRRWLAAISHELRTPSHGFGCWQSKPIRI